MTSQDKVFQENGTPTQPYVFKEGFQVHHLTAPYELLVSAFGNDGSVSPRDECKSMAEWDISTTYGVVEVYDYKVGTCYDSDGLPLEKITEWHVKGEPKAVTVMLSLLDLRQPAEWESRTGVRILDADGWREDGKPWETPITQTEFHRRAADSTINVVVTSPDTYHGGPR